MAITFEDFRGMPCAWLDNGQVRLAVTTQCGPRILFFGRAGGENLLAELPDFTVGAFHFLGGHRLWAAPESLAHTYYPDDDPPLFRLADHEAAPARGVHLTAARPDSQGIVKEIEIRLADPVAAEDGLEVTLTHTLRYAPAAHPHHMTTPPVVAPWALTMCRLGGVAVLPLPHGPADPDGLLPNRLLALWPYTHAADPRLTWGDRFLLVEARPGHPPFKVGWRSSDGWLGYWLPEAEGEGVLFTKHFRPERHADYPDMGCNAECYTNDQFIEIETLGPLAQITAPLVHVETWRLHPGFPRPAPGMALP